MSRVGIETPDADDADKPEGYLALGAEKVKFLRDWYEAKMRESEGVPWLRRDIAGSLGGIDILGGLDGSEGTDGILGGSASASAPGGTGMPVPGQPPFTLGMGDGTDPGVAFFGGMYPTTPWSFEGVDM